MHPAWARLGTQQGSLPQRGKDDSHRWAVLKPLLLLAGLHVLAVLCLSRAIDTPKDCPQR